MKLLGTATRFSTPYIRRDAGIAGWTLLVVVAVVYSIVNLNAGTPLGADVGSYLNNARYYLDGTPPSEFQRPILGPGLPLAAMMQMLGNHVVAVNLYYLGSHLFLIGVSAYATRSYMGGMAIFLWLLLVPFADAPAPLYAQGFLLLAIVLSTRHPGLAILTGMLIPLTHLPVAIIASVTFGFLGVCSRRPALILALAANLLVLAATYDWVDSSTVMPLGALHFVDPRVTSLYILETALIPLMVMIAVNRRRDREIWPGAMLGAMFSAAAFMHTHTWNVDVVLFRLDTAALLLAIYTLRKSSLFARTPKIVFSGALAGILALLIALTPIDRFPESRVIDLLDSIEEGALLASNNGVGAYLQFLRPDLDVVWYEYVYFTALPRTQPPGSDAIARCALRSGAYKDWYESSAWHYDCSTVPPADYVIYDERLSSTMLGYEDVAGSAHLRLARLSP